MESTYGVGIITVAQRRACCGRSLPRHTQLRGPDAYLHGGAEKCRQQNDCAM